jgi:hypothetical protein
VHLLCLAGKLAGELADAQKSLYTEKEPGTPDTPDENGDFHSDRAYSVSGADGAGEAGGVTVT